MQSKAATVTEYMKELPADRRAALEKVRGVIRKHLPKGFKEQMGYGMMGYVVPHRLYPPGYHCDPKQPLPFAGLASQRNYMSFYLMTLYMNPEMEGWLRDQFRERGMKLDMGKCCIRFKKLEDQPLEVIGEAVGRMTVAEYIQRYENGLKKARAKRRSSK
jgi:hypothetical protein